MQHSFQQFGQKSGKCSLHTGAPHFRHANLVLLLCDRPHLWPRFLAVSGSWTLAGYRWRQIRKCAVDGGPHGGRQQRVALVGHVALVTARHVTYYSRIKILTPTCAFKNLWKRQRNAASGVFQNSTVLNDNNWNTFRIQIKHHKLCSENSTHSIQMEIINFATSPLALRWICNSPRTGCARRITPLYTWREQAIIEWSWHVISVVACYHSVKLCAIVARAFWSQQNGAVIRMWRSCQVQPSQKGRAIGAVRCKEGILLQPLRWRCIKCAIRHEWDVREE